MGLVVLQHVESSQINDWTCVSYRWILTHCATGKVLNLCVFWWEVYNHLSHCYLSMIRLFWLPFFWVRCTEVYWFQGFLLIFGSEIWLWCACLWFSSYFSCLGLPEFTKPVNFCFSPNLEKFLSLIPNRAKYFLAIFSVFSLSELYHLHMKLLNIFWFYHCRV